MWLAPTTLLLGRTLCCDPSKRESMTGSTGLLTTPCVACGNVFCFKCSDVDFFFISSTGHPLSWIPCQGPPGPPLRQTTLRRTAQNFALFFPVSLHNFCSSLPHIFSKNFGCVGGTLKCARLEFSGSPATPPRSSFSSCCSFSFYSGLGGELGFEGGGVTPPTHPQTHTTKTHTNTHTPSNHQPPNPPKPPKTPQPPPPNPPPPPPNPKKPTKTRQNPPKPPPLCISLYTLK